MNLAICLPQSIGNIDDNSFTISSNIYLTAKFAKFKLEKVLAPEGKQKIKRKGQISFTRNTASIQLFTYTAEFMKRSFSSLFRSELLFSKSNKACR